MPKLIGTAVRNGRTWTVQQVSWAEQEEVDFLFWLEGMTPEERVEAVGDATLMGYTIKGMNGIPRLRRVHKRFKCKWSKVSNRRGASARAPRSTTRD